MQEKKKKTLWLPENGGREGLNWEIGIDIYTLLCESESCSVMSDSATPWTIHIQSIEFSRPQYWSWQPFPSPGDLPNPEIELRSPTLQADSFPARPQEKPKNTGVGSLSLLQRNFPTQEPNWGLLHCRWILYQLSYKGSPTHYYIKQVTKKKSTL